jgi:beta-galactosidase
MPERPRKSPAHRVALAVGLLSCGGRAAPPGDAAITPLPLPDATGGPDRAPPPVDAAVTVLEGPRQPRLLTAGWKFAPDAPAAGPEKAGFDDGGWAAVAVPHTWDTVRGTTKRPSAWYRTHVPLSTEDTQRRVYLAFEGAFQVADVYLNGQHLGQHRGGYTRFVLDGTAAAVAGDNLLAVKVSSADCADCLPDGNTRLWKGYGGLYRKVSVFTTAPHHIATNDFGSSGVYVTPSKISAASATVSTKILVTNDGPADQTVTVGADLVDPAGQVVLSRRAEQAVKAGTTVPVTLEGDLASPALWSPGHPALYTVRATVGAEDAVDVRVGLRSYALTASDFTLNGVSTRLRGIGKHQETERHASAVDDAELIEDWDNLQDLGVNFVRLVHYPHAALEYDQADQRGIMVWAECGHTNGGAPTPNAENLVREMVFQNWNHPSIIFWSAGNEASGTAATSRYAAVIKAADPARPVVYASNGQSPGGIDFVFRNSYDGWYGGDMYGFLTAGDHWVSETGAGMSLATHTADPFAQNHQVNSFEPEEYGALVDEVRFDDLFRRPTHVPAFAGWVFRDIGDNKYRGVVNSKGLMTFAGYKKDVFFHYQALLQPSPVVHLVGAHYFLRDPAPGGHAPVKAYANTARLSLTVNGADKGTLDNGKYTHPNGTPINDVFFWPDALAPGRNEVTVSDGMAHSDAMTVYLRGAEPGPAGKIAHLTSSKDPAYFIDAPVGAQRPFYYDLDGTADNTFDLVPEAAAGAGWIATRRQSDPARATALAFDVTAAAELFVMVTRQPAAPAWITAAGFTDTGATGLWRDNALALVSYTLYRRTAAAGDHLALAGGPIDYVVLVK